MATTTEETRKRSSTAIVLEAVKELHAQEQIVTRETLAQVTGLKMSIIDDRIGVLVDEDEVLRVRAGVFVPAIKHPPARSMSKTILENGLVKIEIGDEVLTLTPKEDRALASLQAGAAVQLAAIELGHQTSVLAAEQAEKIKRLERRLEALQAKVDPRQLELVTP